VAFEMSAPLRSPRCVADDTGAMGRSVRAARPGRWAR